MCAAEWQCSVQMYCEFLTRDFDHKRMGYAMCKIFYLEVSMSVNWKLSEMEKCTGPLWFQY